MWSRGHFSGTAAPTTGWCDYTLREPRETCAKPTDFPLSPGSTGAQPFTPQSTPYARQMSFPEHCLGHPFQDVIIRKPDPLWQVIRQCGNLERVVPPSVIKEENF